MYALIQEFSGSIFRISEYNRVASLFLSLWQAYKAVTVDGKSGIGYSTGYQFVWNWNNRFVLRFTQNHTCENPFGFTLNMALYGMTLFATDEC